MVRLSVIIPTHRRPEILAECLRHLEQQTIASELEVIVVSDGPTEMQNAKCKMQNVFLEIPKSQQGAARNKGVAEAKGEYVLFIGDDIFLAPEACARHLEAHEQCKMQNAPYSAPDGALQGKKCKMDEGKILNSPAFAPVGAMAGKQFSILNSYAVLGFTTWDPAVGITPVMRWLERSGWQFGYPMISRYAHGCIPEKIQHQFTYTSHISLPLEIAKKYPFRMDVRLYGWEDVEWGMRLKNAGVRLFYEPDARALHYHHIELEDSLKRMEILGRSAVEISKKIPGFDRVPRGWKLLAYRLLSLLPTIAGRHRRRFLDGIGC